MPLISKLDDHAEPKLQRGRGDRQVVRGDHGSHAAQRREEVSPALGRLAAEVHERQAGNQRLDPRPPGRRAPSVIGEPYADEEFGINHGGHDGRLVANLTQRLLPAFASAVELDQRARVDD